jgi:hypothetical protein
MVQADHLMRRDGATSSSPPKEHEVSDDGRGGYGGVSVRSVKQFALARADSLADYVRRAEVEPVTRDHAA